MKLINPTDEALNMAFAWKVAGWTQSFDEDSGGNRYAEWWDGTNGPLDANFTGSFDAVLPWLEKCDSWNMEYDQGEIEETTVNVWAPHHGQYKGDGPLPRAVCIAIIRANGHEIIFQ